MSNRDKSSIMAERDTLLGALADMVSVVKPEQILKIAVDGIDCAGKTIFADELKPLIEAKGRHVIRSGLDRFHNPRKIRYSRGRYNPEGYYFDSFDYQALVDRLLLPLSPGGSMRYVDSVFNYEEDTPVDLEYKYAIAGDVLLFDGVFLLRPELFNFWDLKIFLEIDYDESLSRCLERDHAEASKIKNLYSKRYIPGQKLYMIHCDPKRKADIVIDNSKPLKPKISYINRGLLNDNEIS
jgi:uridine kinase